MTGTIVRLLAALSAGFGAWCSLGTLAVTHTGGRVGLLPPAWTLGLAIAVPAAIVFGLRWSASRALPLFASLLFALPWIPGTTVEAALVFSGPVAALWWALVAAACLAAGPVPVPAAVAALARDPRRAPWMAGAIVAVVSSAGAVNFQDWLPGGDEPHYLVITQSLMRDGDLQIENNHKRGDYLAYYPSDLPPDYLRRGTNRQIYSIHAPGLSALVIPAFAIGGYAGVVVFLILCGALGAALAWWLGYRLAGSAGAAWAGWAVVASSITFVAHNFMVFPDGVSGVCILVGLWAVFQRPTAPAWRFGALAAVVALLPWLHTRNAPVALVIGLAVAWPLARARAWRPALAWLAPLAVSALAWLASFWMIYGAIDPSAPYGGYTQSGPANVPRGLLGLLVDQQFGLLAYAPALAIGLVGLILMARMPHGTSPAPGSTVEPAGVSPRTLAGILAAVIVPYSSLAASYTMWWGGASAPARFLTPMVLPLALPAAVAWQRCRSRAARAAMLGLIVASAVVLGALLSLQRGIMTFNGRDGFAALSEWASPVGDLSQALPALHRDPLEVSAQRAALWIAVPLVSLLVGWALSRRPRSTRGAVALGMLASAGLLTVGVSAASWTIRGVPGARADASQVRLLAALADASPDAVALAFRDAPRSDIPGRTERATRRITRDDLVSRLSFSTSFRRPPRSTAFGAGRLPAGRYRLVATTSDASAGSVDVALGREGASLRAIDWSVAAGPATATVEFDLAVPVRLVTVRGTDEALKAVSSVMVKPLQIRPRDRRLGTEDVERLARNGSSFVYLLSDAQYVERDGLWLRPTVRVPMVVAPDARPAAGPLHVFLRNGPFENDVTLDATSSQVVTLAPGEERVVPVEVAWIDGAARLVVRASRGFRPREIDTASTDPRLLGVWVAFP